MTALISPQTKDLILQEQTNHLTINEYHALLRSVETKYNGLPQYRANFDVNVYFKPMNPGPMLEKWESNMIIHFENEFGSAPICNGQIPHAEWWNFIGVVKKIIVVPPDYGR